MLRFQLKRLLKWLVCSPVANWLIRLLRSPLKALLSEANVIRIPVVGEITASVPGGSSFVMINDGDDRIATRIYWLGLESYEDYSLSIFRSLAQRSRTLLDIGANSGVFALTAVASNPDATVFAFEPVPAIYACLKRNAERNDPSRLKVFHLALSDTDGELPLYVPRGFQTFPLTSSVAAGFRDDCDIIAVPSARLSTFASAQGMGGIDLIKLDTESTEHLVIRGGLTVIERDLPIMICEVQPGESGTLLHRLLDPLGYKYFWITGKGLIPEEQIVGDPTLVDSNYLFVPEPRVTEILGICWSVFPVK